MPLKQLMSLDVGDTLSLELKPDALVTVRCGNVALTEGRMGRVGDKVAVRVVKPLRKPKTTFAMFEIANVVFGLRSGLTTRTATLSRAEEHTSELESPTHLVCRRLVEQKDRE